MVSQAICMGVVHPPDFIIQIHSHGGSPVSCQVSSYVGEEQHSSCVGYSHQCVVIIEAPILFPLSDEVLDLGAVSEEGVQRYSV